MWILGGLIPLLQYNASSERSIESVAIIVMLLIKPAIKKHCRILTGVLGPSFLKTTQLINPKNAWNVEHIQFICSYYTLPETNSSPLKIYG